MTNGRDVPPGCTVARAASPDVYIPARATQRIDKGQVLTAKYPFFAMAVGRVLW